MSERMSETRRLRARKSRGRMALALALACSLPPVIRAEEPQPTFGGTLLYSRLTEGTWQIWQTDLATGQTKPLTASAGDKRAPSWGPEGAVVHQTSNQAAYTVSPSGSESRAFLTAWWPVRDLVWSPDRVWLAFSRIRTDLVDAANIWVADAHGDHPRMLTDEAGMQYQPAWSPDGTQLAYVGGHGYGTYELYVVNVDGTNRRQLTKNQSHEFLPAWSPDGRRIAFTSDASGDYEIWVVETSGARLTQWTHAPGLDTRPAWSPDGRHLAFTTNRTGTLEIWVMDAEGTHQRPLLAGEAPVQDPAWHE